ncbi:MAG TPA: NAD-dependent epimerase/dehydratase family protein [Flexilinea sp.]|jgi:dihydroflavonol-4-reductase|nr:NAD-dependent epimerase/dehydratase family protein [Flexilinea sp.]HPJ64508.1 NAD-dependent epimerase/dehydratase family protein [Flexilinea sp.]HPR71097.1 NAD-dependent epimerase/dehydratase family protein [Flexilinea sp.]
MTTILVTGATGFIGSALCRELCERGYQVIGFHRLSSSLKMIEGLPIQRVIGDLTDESSIENAFSYHPEIVFHLGAQQFSGRNLTRLMDVNVGGTRRIFQASFNAHVKRIILMSSAVTMGTAELSPDRHRSPKPVVETHGWDRTLESWPFAWSKLLAEYETQWAIAYGMDIVICNPMFVIGPGDYYRRNTGLIARFHDKPPKFFIEGGINLIHVNEVVQGLIQAMNYGEKGRRYLLSGTDRSFQQFFGDLAKLSGTPAPRMQLPTGFSNRLYLYRNRHPDLFPVEKTDINLLRMAGKYFYYDGKNSRLALHLPPPQPIEPALQETLNWFRENK